MYKTITDEDIKNSNVDIKDLKSTLDGFVGVVHYGIAYPVLYINNSLLLFFYYNKYSNNETKGLKD